MPNTKTKRSRNHGTANCSASPTPNNDKASIPKVAKISRFFTKLSKTGENLSDSPYQNCLQPVECANLSDSSDMDHFRTPTAIKKVSKIAKLPKNTKKRKNKGTTKAPVRKFLEDNFQNSDVNADHLQMALALSESSYEANNPNESGIPNKRESVDNFKRVLEKYGFGYGKNKKDLFQIVTSTNKKSYSRSRYRFVTPILKMRTQEERDTLISSKVSLILAQNSRIQTNFSNEAIELHDDTLRGYHSDKLFKLNCLGLEDLNQEGRFYCKGLKIEECSVPAGCLLKDWLKIPGRDISPIRGNNRVFSSEEKNSMEEKRKSKYVYDGSVSPDLFDSDDETGVLSAKSIPTPEFSNLIETSNSAETRDNVNTPIIAECYDLTQSDEDSEDTRFDQGTVESSENGDIRLLNAKKEENDFDIDNTEIRQICSQSSSQKSAPKKCLIKRSFGISLDEANFNAEENVKNYENSEDPKHDQRKFSVELENQDEFLDSSKSECEYTSLLNTNKKRIFGENDSDLEDVEFTQNCSQYSSQKNILNGRKSCSFEVCFDETNLSFNGEESFKKCEDSEDPKHDQRRISVEVEDQIELLDSSKSEDEYISLLDINKKREDMKILDEDCDLHFPEVDENCRKPSNKKTTPKLPSRRKSIRICSPGDLSFNAEKRIKQYGDVEDPRYDERRISTEIEDQIEIESKSEDEYVSLTNTNKESIGTKSFGEKDSDLDCPEINLNFDRSSTPNKKNTPNVSPGRKSIRISSPDETILSFNAEKRITNYEDFEDPTYNQRRISTEIEDQIQFLDSSKCEDEYISLLEPNKESIQIDQNACDLDFPEINQNCSQSSNEKRTPKLPSGRKSIRVSSPDETNLSFNVEKRMKKFEDFEDPSYDQRGISTDRVEFLDCSKSEDGYISLVPNNECTRTEIKIPGLENPEMEQNCSQSGDQKSATKVSSGRRSIKVTSPDETNCGYSTEEMIKKYENMYNPRYDQRRIFSEGGDEYISLLDTNNDSIRKQFDQNGFSLEDTKTTQNSQSNNQESSPRISIRVSSPEHVPVEELELEYFAPNLEDTTRKSLECQNDTIIYHFSDTENAQKGHESPPLSEPFAGEWMPPAPFHSNEQMECYNLSDSDEQMDEVKTKLKKNETTSTSEDSKLSQESIYISDDELNYSNAYATPHHKKDIDEPPQGRETHCKDIPTQGRILRQLDPQIVGSNQTPTNTGRVDNDVFVIKTKNITPMANYDGMDTPKIVKELDKFGLKPLKRQRGAKLLKYIYESTHPLVEDECDYDDDDDRIVKKRRTGSYHFEGVVGDIDEDQWIFEKTQSKRLSSCRIPLHIAWHNFIASNPKILENVLLYEPLQLEVLHSMLKAQTGFKFNIQDLLAFLDKKCITVRTAQGQRNGKKHRS